MYLCIFTKLLAKHIGNLPTGFGWVGKAQTLRATHLSSSLAACRSLLVGILSGVDPPTRSLCCRRRDRPQLSIFDRCPTRRCNITIKAPFSFLNQEKKRNILETYLTYLTNLWVPRKLKPNMQFVMDSTLGTKKWLVLMYH